MRLRDLFSWFLVLVVLRGFSQISKICFNWIQSYLFLFIFRMAGGAICFSCFPWVAFLERWAMARINSFWILYLCICWFINFLSGFYWLMVVIIEITALCMGALKHLIHFSISHFTCYFLLHVCLEKSVPLFLEGTHALRKLQKPIIVCCFCRKES